MGKGITRKRISAKKSGSSGGGGGTVTSVSGTAPVVSSGGNTPVISMHVADATNDGYLSSTDWNTFNNGPTLTQAEIAFGSNTNTITSDPGFIYDIITVGRVFNAQALIVNIGDVGNLSNHTYIAISDNIQSVVLSGGAMGITIDGVGSTVVINGGVNNTSLTVDDITQIITCQTDNLLNIQNVLGNLFAQIDFANRKAAVGDISSAGNGTLATIDDQLQQVTAFAGSTGFLFDGLSTTVQITAGATILILDGGGTVSLNSGTNEIQIKESGGIVNTISTGNFFSINNIFQIDEFGVFNKYAGVTPSTTTVTTGSLVGKTMTFVGGVLTDFS